MNYLEKCDITSKLQYKRVARDGDLGGVTFSEASDNGKHKCIDFL